ncbi:hypothetical protein AQ857_19535 [Burkholderia pseudomallei]|nr:hypothetical protein AQ858_29165 [Burkholderia pseudomallei]OMZ21594.1 hypothetical protein AQ857_19535 [Burkholderia pseudomallei]
MEIHAAARRLGRRRRRADSVHGSGRGACRRRCRGCAARTDIVLGAVSVRRMRGDRTRARRGALA